MVVCGVGNRGSSGRHDSRRSKWEPEIIRCTCAASSGTVRVWEALLCPGEVRCGPDLTGKAELDHQRGGSAQPRGGIQPPSLTLPYPT